MRLYQIRRTCCEMLADRGYLVGNVSKKLLGGLLAWQGGVQPGDDGSALGQAASSTPLTHPTHQHPHHHECHQQTTQDDLKATFDEFKARFGGGGGDGGGGAVAKDRLTLLQAHRSDPSRRILVFFPEASKVGVKEIKEVSERMKEESVARAILVVAQSLTPFARSVVADMQGKQAMEVFTEAELLVNVTRHALVPSHRVLSPEEKATLLARYKVKESQLPRIQLSDPVARYYGLQRGEVVRIVRASETAGRYVTYRWCV